MAESIEILDNDVSVAPLQYNSMVADIGTKLAVAKVKPLEQLCIDVVCSHVYESVVSDDLNVYTLPIPKCFINEIIERVDAVTSLYFYLFIEPTILCSQDQISDAQNS
ncbi:MAG: hypothetical protein MJE68_32405 [Proteobacteria bacterium]|nr:hypothetical protein [Pseudomonadota bacterium]